MAYSVTNGKGQQYFLHGKTVILRGGREQFIMYFAREVKEEFALEELPEGREVVFNEKTGLPLVKRSDK
ncbi:hypothetical protein HOD30_03030 [Candidatus Peregrinibacteria bacterium]|jgi:hypothetical protein|nr:hypothetical protein [Candidatus Peregrinibacteria bacterium]MBT4632067.1 hypothetical protein [Candidatus Peregrinibacteria bacterium]MBT5516300.1 hypothetical protein [Candidatus Peregrinibacteria bacterium]MBT5823721.1 hypothetical protein [Candidatus Peregrinibacteria bacterium]